MFTTWNGEPHSHSAAFMSVKDVDWNDKHAKWYQDLTVHDEKKPFLYSFSTDDSWNI